MSTQLPADLRQLQQALDAMDEGIIWIDASFRLLGASASLVASMGLAEGASVMGQLCHALRGASPEAFVRDEHTGRCTGCPVPDSLAQGRPVVRQLEALGGWRWEVSCWPTATRAICRYRSLTGLARRLGGALPLTQLDRQLGLGKLARAMAHEINSPLTGLIVFAESLARTLAPDTPGATDVAEIVDSAHRCRRIIQTFQQFAQKQRRGSGGSGAVQLSAAVDEALSVLRHRIAVRGVTIAVQLPAELPAVRADLADLEQLLVNLISNATEACDRGDTITISARCCDAGAEQGAPGAALELSVVDHGAGMDRDTLAAARAPFFTTRGGQAVGLGLAACDALVAALGGALVLESVPGEGTIARVRLPLAPPPAGESPADERG